MDKEYLEDYEQKEQVQRERLQRDIMEGKFSFGKDRYPGDERFVKLNRPVALAGRKAAMSGDLWAQVPFSGSLILLLPSISRKSFEKDFFKVSEIPMIIDFIKETGRIQVALSMPAILYEGLNFLNPFFEELNPPIYHGFPMSILGTKKELKTVKTTFDTIATVRYINYIFEAARKLDFSSQVPSIVLNENLRTYTILKLGHFLVVEEIENLMIDNPERALALFRICSSFITFPAVDLRSTMINYTLEETRRSSFLPIIYRPQEIRFPCEIGKFLMKKLTYVPQGMRACYDLINRYEDYDLRKVQQSLNKAIVTNHPDIINKSAEDLSEILDNVWNDKTIPKRIENIRIGVPVSIAAVGAVAGGLIGGPSGIGTGGFLAELGFKVGQKAVEKFFSVKGERLGERVARLRTKNYQANIYDFKKKYKHRTIPT